MATTTCIFREVVSKKKVRAKTAKIINSHRIVLRDVRRGWLQSTKMSTRMVSDINHFGGEFTYV